MLPHSYHLITPVWGKEYIDLFLRVCVPSLFSPQNLRVFSTASGDRYKIYTTSKGRMIIEGSSVYRKLTDIITVDFQIIDDMVEACEEKKTMTVYDVMTRCFMDGIKSAKEKSAASIFIIPDSVYSEGSLFKIKEVVLSGKRLVMCACPRVITETAVPAILGRFYSEDCISLSSRKLVKLALSNLHPSNNALFWDVPSFNAWPSCILWKVGSEGMIIRAFHLHFLAIYPLRDKEITYSGRGIDAYDYFQRAVPDYNDVHIFTDSDELAVISFESIGNLKSPFTNIKANPLLITLWALDQCYQYHLNFVKTKIRFHSEDISSRWKAVEEESDGAYDSIMASIDLLGKLPPDMYKRTKDIYNYVNHTNGLLTHFALESAFTHNKLGEILYKLKLIDKAESEFLRAQEIAPNAVEVQNNLAVLYFENGDIKKAIKHIGSAVKNNPLDRNTVLNFALIHGSSGNIKDAIHALERLLSIKDDYAVRSKLEEIKNLLASH